MATNKKITRVGRSKDTSTSGGSSTPTGSSSGSSNAKTFRIIAIVLWAIAIGIEVWAILLLRKPPINTTTLIIQIVVMLVLTMAGSFLWKKSNRLDPASREDKFRFFVQNQLGAIISVIAFLPLVILIFTNKNLSKQQKGLVGTIAAAALVIAGLTGTEFNPTAKEDVVQESVNSDGTSASTGDFVYWTKSGKSYHLFSDCSYINGLRTDEIFEGTIEDAKELKNITDLCDRCSARQTRLSNESQTSEEEILDEVINQNE